MLLKKLFRTLWHYKAQFISMVIMIALGVGVFLGFNIEWYSLDVSTREIYDATGFADFRIFSENGFSEADLEKVLAIDGVEDATRYLSVNTAVKDDSDTIALTVSTNDKTTLVRESSDDYVMQGAQSFSFVGNPVSTEAGEGLAGHGEERGVLGLGPFLSLARHRGVEDAEEGRRRNVARLAGVVLLAVELHVAVDGKGVLEDGFGLLFGEGGGGSRKGQAQGQQSQQGKAERGQGGFSHGLLLGRPALQAIGCLQ